MGYTVAFAGAAISTDLMGRALTVRFRETGGLNAI
jgi:hypothetical protein